MLLTAGALVEVEESTGKTDGSGKAHRLGETSLADVGGRELLKGEESAGAESRSYGSVSIVGRSGIADDSLKVAVRGRQLAIDIIEVDGGRKSESNIRVVVDELCEERQTLAQVGVARKRLRAQHEPDNHSSRPWSECMFAPVRWPS